MTADMTADMIVNAIVTLVVTIDPVGLAPLFLAVTVGMDRGQRREVGTRAIAIAFAIMVLFAVLGTAILAIFGVTLAAFRVAGGLLLFAIAFEMIFEKRQERHENTATRAVTNDRLRSVAVFPLAIPLIAGPGAISAVVLLSGDFAGPLARLALIAIVAGILTVTWAVFILAERVDRLLGETGRSVLTRLLGVILSALAVQFVADGVRTLMAA
ncbi:MULTISPECIES: MarC family protein [unclassified Roseitalea]|uniref:MarC family protein n=1 Tax=unclassified Roseitalea TaxID=2639107 RepID=UPI00273FACEA|nr:MULTISPECIES: MarC family protein [unclassified Roseitalea]